MPVIVVRARLGSFGRLRIALKGERERLREWWMRHVLRRERPFGSGTQYGDWQMSNCERCAKGSPGAETFEEIACPLERAISEAYMGDGTVPREVALRLAQGHPEQSRGVARRIGALDAETAVWRCPEWRVRPFDRLRVCRERRRCVVCGCADREACEDPRTGRPCHWMPGMTADGEGPVCSACFERDPARFTEPVTIQGGGDAE